MWACVVICALLVLRICDCTFKKCPYRIIAKDDNGTCCIDTILQAHNYYRDMISNGEVPGQPPAKKLKPLQWDASLAQAAQRVADTCEFEHIKINEPKFRHVGQNLYQKCSTKPDLLLNYTHSIKSWFMEHEIYTYPTTPSKETGHYTQLVWEDTEYVGCACTIFKLTGEEAQRRYGCKTRKRDFYCKFYVCNYGPGGNVVGRAPYRPA